ncbi:UNVERIFIED_CONTAM: hypothetical protein PYX00_007951 [Menopon gallinae]|uniref:Uncharacterized protein n=1 Tax=Menopon gallinae TaxID=328185 RepID=A0AAW2HLA1_9NEOP
MGLRFSELGKLVRKAPVHFGKVLFFKSRYVASVSEMDTITEEEPTSEDARRISRDPDRDQLVRSVGGGWNEFLDQHGRRYYYNAETDEKNWKPPRKTQLTQVTILRKKKKEYKFGSGNVSVGANPTGSRLSLQNDYEVVPQQEGRRKYDEVASKLEGRKCVGRLLKTGVLSTAVVRKTGMGKKKWTTSYVVLTEYYIIFTARTGFLRKLFKKSESPKVYRFYLPEVFVRREMNLSKRCSVFRLSGISREILFTTQNETEAETWYQILKLVCNQLAVSAGESAHTPNCLRDLVIPKSSLERSFSVDSEATTLSRSSSMSPFHAKNPLPPGWIDRYDPATGKFYYVNSITGKKWFSEISVDGDLFFFEEDSCRASWSLPPVYPDFTLRPPSVTGSVKSTPV